MTTLAGIGILWELFFLLASFIGSFSYPPVGSFWRMEGCIIKTEARRV